MRALASSKHVSFVTWISCGEVIYHRSSEIVAQESHINRATQMTLNGVQGRPNRSLKEVWSSPEGHTQVPKGGSVPKANVHSNDIIVDIMGYSHPIKNYFHAHLPLWSYLIVITFGAPCPAMHKYSNTRKL